MKIHMKPHDDGMDFIYESHHHHEFHHEIHRQNHDDFQEIIMEFIMISGNHLVFFCESMMNPMMISGTHDDD